MKTTKTTLFIVAFFICQAFVACNKDKEPQAETRPEWTFYAKPFDKVPSLDNMRIYEAAPRVFAKSNSLKAIQGHLDEIAALSTNVLWIMPINMAALPGGPQPYGSPYATRNFYGIDVEYGTVDDLRDLVKEAHKKGIAVIIDVATNHTSNDNVWIKTHPEWYPKDDTGEIVDIDKASVKLDWTLETSTELRKEFIRMLKYWIAAINIDGYRFDSADFIDAAFWKEVDTQLKSFEPGREVILLAEGTSLANLEVACDMNYGWSFCDVLEKVYAGTNKTSTLLTTNAREFNDIAAFMPKKTKMRFSTNHDRTSKASPVEKYTNIRGSMSAFVLSMTMGGVPMVYSSQEIGYPDRISIFKNDTKVMDWSLNPEILAEYKKLMSLHATGSTMRAPVTTTYANTDILSFSKSDANGEVYIAVNVRNTAKSVGIDAALQGKTFKNLMTNQNITLSSALSLGAYEYLILQKI